MNGSVLPSPPHSVLLGLVLWALVSSSTNEQAHLTACNSNFGTIKALLREASTYPNRANLKRWDVRARVGRQDSFHEAFLPGCSGHLGTVHLPMSTDRWLSQQGWNKLLQSSSGRQLPGTDPGTILWAPQGTPLPSRVSGRPQRRPLPPSRQSWHLVATTGEGDHTAIHMGGEWWLRGAQRAR